MVSLSFKIQKLLIASTIFREVLGKETTDTSGDPSPCPYNQKLGTSNSCEDCPIGTYGLNCKQKCPPGYFGEFCRSKCKCYIHSCNRKYGCLDSVVTTTDITTLTNEVNDVSDEDENNNNQTLIPKNNKEDGSEHHISQSWTIVNFTVIGLLCAFTIIGILAFIRSWVMKRTFEPGAMTEIINRNEDQRLNAGPGFQRSHVDSTYAEIRYSKMIENNQGMRGQKRFSAKNTQNIMENQEGACGGKNFQNEAEEKCGNNDYDHFSSENGYSFLSLKFSRSKRNFTRPSSNIFRREKSPSTTVSIEGQYFLSKNKGNEAGSVTHDYPENGNLLAQNQLHKKNCLERYSFVQNTFCKNDEPSISMVSLPEESGETNNLNQSINPNDCTYEERKPTDDTITPRTGIYSNAYFMNCEVDHTVLEETDDNTTNDLH